MNDDSKRHWMVNVVAEGVACADAPPLRPNA
jgi:hypothetical protein